MARSMNKTYKQIKFVYYASEGEIDKTYTTSYTECMKYARHLDHKSRG